MSSTARVYKIVEQDSATEGEIQYQVWYEALPPTNDVLIDTASYTNPTTATELLDDIVGRLDLEWV